jgi:hypothetical protein
MCLTSSVRGKSARAAVTAVVRTALARRPASTGHPSAEEPLSEGFGRVSVVVVVALSVASVGVVSPGATGIAIIMPSRCILAPATAAEVADLLPK